MSNNADYRKEADRCFRALFDAGRRGDAREESFYAPLAALVSDVEQMLNAAGVSRILVETKPESREFIKNWFPGSGIEECVVSANIVARKPDSNPAPKEHGRADAKPQTAETCCILR